MNCLKYLIIAFVPVLTLALATVPVIAGEYGRGGHHGGGHGGHNGHKGHVGYKGYGGYKKFGGYRGYKGHRGYKRYGGHKGYGGYKGYSYGYYRPYYKPYRYYRPYYKYGYYWPYLIPPLVFGALSYYQYHRPVYYPTYPNSVNQEVIISPQAQAPQTQGVPQEKSGTYQITVKDRYGNQQEVSVPIGHSVTVSEGKNGQLQINVVKPPTPRQTDTQGDPIEGYNESDPQIFGSGIPIKQTGTIGWW